MVSYKDVGEPGSIARIGSVLSIGEKVNRKSQNEEILAWLQSGKSISPLEALEKFGCFRLGGRIYELKSEGWPIVTDMVTKNGKRFAEYRLEKSNGN